MIREGKLAEELLDFIYESPSPFHVVENIKKDLLENGFQELSLVDRWKLNTGGKYFVVKNDSALIAFEIGSSGKDRGFKIIGAHTDSPTFKVKPNPEIIEKNKYLKLNTEVYGGPILNTWMDRPLTLAGRVTMKGHNPLKPISKLINFDRPMVIIPNVAIHMNRKINEGIELNKQKDLLPLVMGINDKLEGENYLVNAIAKELDISYTDIKDFELYLSEFERGSIIGAKEEFISCGKLDDLAMVHSGIKALINASPSDQTKVMVCFDNEEIGSQTKQGAGSPMLKTILERITLGLNGDREDFLRGLNDSYIISADMAHAVHPNSPEKHDPTNKPVLNGGPVIKINANQRYTTDSDSGTVFEHMCELAGVPVQKFVNRSDERGGSTIGPISSGQLDIRSVDVGNPMLAMHSIRELGGVKDHYYMMEVFNKFFSI
ncbi:M18 family aminopeptidase [Clostridiisalibacter paucivorans]|uniref:M18 family aminopeptidase n=1 Tax=Clostridiisalibacter paucivorans TaxID=408753 RepID=UPI000556AE6D|nr:M18 family aminopeptidase [Clostridiisalibacter paucivorans]